MMKYDIIVIGAGLGGLTAGAKLSREGKKVLLLEQHSKPGGCATTFQRGDFTMEVGLHEMDGPSPFSMSLMYLEMLNS
jgi:all-trans-retinol 13,14-reductase